MEERDSSLAEEIEILESIYIHELEVVRDEQNDVKQLVLQLHPATGDDVGQQFVCMTLVLDLPSKYPDEPPDIVIKNPRGIAEEEVQSLREDMHTLCEERLGGPMLYELIELAKDSLTAGNIPHCACMICLEHFHEGEQVCKTTCYHYFHGTCLARYVKHTLADQDKQRGQNSKALHVVLEPSKLLCPVCREEINPSVDELPETPVEGAFNFQPSTELRDQQRKMADMLERQRARGGVIDVEAEKNKYLVTDDVVVLAPPSASRDREASKSPRPSDRTDTGDGRSSQSPRSGHGQRKGRGGRSEQISKSKTDGRNNNTRKGDNQNMRSAGRITSAADKPSIETKDGATVRSEKASESLDKKEKETFNSEKSDVIERNFNARKGVGKPTSKGSYERDSCRKEDTDESTERNDISKDATDDVVNLKSGNVNRKEFTQRRGFGRPPHRDNYVTESSNQHRPRSSVEDRELGEDRTHGNTGAKHKAESKSEMYDNDRRKDDYRNRDRNNHRNGRQSDTRPGSGNDTAMKFDGYTRHDKRYRQDEDDISEIRVEDETVSSRSHHRKGFGRPPHLNDRKEASHRDKKPADDVYDRESELKNVNNGEMDNNISQRGSQGTDGKGSFVDSKDVKEIKGYDSHGYNCQNKSMKREGKHDATSVHDREKEKYHEGGRRPHRRGGFGRPHQGNDRKTGQTSWENSRDGVRNGEIKEREGSLRYTDDNDSKGKRISPRQDDVTGVDDREKETYHEGGRRPRRRGGFGRPHQGNDRKSGQASWENSRDGVRNGEIETREDNLRYTDDDSKGKRISPRQDDVLDDRRVPVSGDGHINRGNDDHVHDSYYSNSYRKDEVKYSNREEAVPRDSGRESYQRRGFGRPSYSNRGKRHGGGNLSTVGDEEVDSKSKDDRTEEGERKGYRTSPRENKSSSFKGRHSDYSRKFSKNSDDYQSVSKSHDSDNRSGSDCFKHDQKMSSNSKIKAVNRDHNKDDFHSKRQTRNEGLDDRNEVQGEMTSNSKQCGGRGGRKTGPPPGFSESVPPGFQGTKSSDKVLTPPPGL